MLNTVLASFNFIDIILTYMITTLTVALFSRVLAMNLTNAEQYWQYDNQCNALQIKYKDRKYVTFLSSASVGIEVLPVIYISILPQTCFLNTLLKM